MVCRQHQPGRRFAEQAAAPAQDCSDQRKTHSANADDNGSDAYEHGDDQIYHQPLSYVGAIFCMNCQSEEDAFWLLTVMPSSAR